MDANKMVNFTANIKDGTYDIEGMQEHDIDEVKSLFVNAMSGGDGLSKNEFESEESLVAYLHRAKTFVLRKRPDQRPIGVSTLVKSPLVRSQDSMYHAGYMILKPEARGKGLATIFVKELLPHVHKEYGYVAAVARTATVSKALLTVSRGNWTIMGTIPNSMYFPQFGWVEDLICYSSTEPEDEKDLPIWQDPKSLPPLKEPNYKFLLNEDRLKLVVLPPLFVKEEEFSVSFAQPNDVKPVEEMIREAALEGIGFAADEFTPDGYMNRCLLRRSHMLVVKLRGEIKAGIIFGPTAVCRETTSTQVGGYMIIKKSDRGNGLGNALLDYCIENMEKLDYTAILTDVFASNLPMLKIMQKRGFMATATVPNSGVMNGKGRTHTYLMYKQRKNVKKAKL